VRIDATADDSFAAIRARSKFGIAIAAMIRMIATTMSSSIRESLYVFAFSGITPSHSGSVVDILNLYLGALEGPSSSV
jgi:hypothetical protein